MKIKISESKIKRIVNEEILKSGLHKTIKEQRWPSYTAYLIAELYMLEYSAKAESMKEELFSQEMGVKAGGGFSQSDADKEFAQWVTENANYVTPEDVQEAKGILGQSKGAGQASTGEGLGGFLKAVAAPYKNIWQTMTNLTQKAANATDPEAKKAAQATGQVVDQMPEPEEVIQQAKGADSQEEMMAMLKQILALLGKADQAVDLDALQPGLEDQVDDVVDDIETTGGEVVQTGGDEGGGEEAAAAPTVAVFKGKGGKGLQSFLDRSGSEEEGMGKVFGAILKHVSNNLKQQGVTVTESVMDDVQGWIWHGLAEDAVRDTCGEKVLSEVVGEGLGFDDPSAEPAGRAEAGGEVGGVVPVIQIFKGRKGKGLQSWMDINREKLGIDDETVKLLLMTVQDWAKANKLKVENISHKALGRIIPEVLNRHRVRKLQERLKNLRNAV